MAKYALNTILYGPPGTGKTFTIRKRAVDICIRTEYRAGDTPEDNREYNKKYNELQEEGRIRFVTFHQSYGYEEFIEGIRPVMAGRKPTKASGTDGALNVGEISDTDGSAAGELRYEVRDGAFKAFCRTAEEKLNETEEPAPDSAPKQAETVSEVTSTINKIKNKIEKRHYVWLMNVSKDFNLHRYWKDCDVVSLKLDDPQHTDETDKTVLKRKIKKGDYIIVRRKKENADQTDDTIAVGIAQVVEENATIKPKYQFLERGVQWLYLAEDENESLNIKNSGLFPELDHNNEFWKRKDSASDYGVLIRDNYVFIIDEINRGNISKIFGELITLIEEDKRGIGNREPEPGEYPMSARLPYSGEDFSVPANVYILGTMNTADRSIALLDTALRRRFTFEEMMPDSGKLDDLIIKRNNKEINVKKLMDAMNSRIEVLLDREHQIGHAYFMPLKSNPDFDKLADIFKNKIIPLLQEYFYDDYEKIKMVLNDNKFVKEEEKVASRFYGQISDYDYPEKLYSINTGEMNNEDNYIKIYSTNKQNNE